GECVMGSKGTLVVEQEQSVMLYGTGGRSTAVSVNTSSGAPVLDTSATTGPAEGRAVETGQNALGTRPPSRGYTDEMEHFAYIIPTRDQLTAAERAALKPRCDGRAAMADAIIALTANQAMRRQQRIVFDPKWFDAATTDVPDADMKYRDHRGQEIP